MTLLDILTTRFPSASFFGYARYVWDEGKPPLCCCYMWQREKMKKLQVENYSRRKANTSHTQYHWYNVLLNNIPFRMNETAKRVTLRNVGYFQTIFPCSCYTLCYYVEFNWEIIKAIAISIHNHTNVCACLRLNNQLNK